MFESDICEHYTSDLGTETDQIIHQREHVNKHLRDEYMWICDEYWIKQKQWFKKKKKNLIIMVDVNASLSRFFLIPGSGS